MITAIGAEDTSAQSSRRGKPPNELFEALLLISLDTVAVSDAMPVHTESALETVLLEVMGIVNDTDSAEPVHKCMRDDHKTHNERCVGVLTWLNSSANFDLIHYKYSRTKHSPALFFSIACTALP